MSGPLLDVRNLDVRFGAVRVLDDVTFQLPGAQTVGLVGESGSGKSTLARALLRLIPAASGRVLWCGADLLTSPAKELRRRRRDLQMVFQDPLASLNPRLTVGDALAEPLRIHEPLMQPRERDQRVGEMLERVGLGLDDLRRYPREFSGGQCQRIGIARAMMLRPKLLICDEPVSSLDVSIQGQIVNLLVDLQREFGTAMLFISHNLALIRHVSRRVLVIYRGRLVETADADALFAQPRHPYTRALLAAVPDLRASADLPAVPDLRAAPGPRAELGSPIPDDDIAVPPQAAGCAFQARCPHAQAPCRTLQQRLEEVAPGHFAACSRWREVVYS